jgi:hypothetical protein
MRSVTHLASAILATSACVSSVSGAVLDLPVIVELGYVSCAIGRQIRSSLILEETRRPQHWNAWSAVSFLVRYW